MKLIAWLIECLCASLTQSCCLRDDSFTITANVVQSNSLYCVSFLCRNHFIKWNGSQSRFQIKVYQIHYGFFLVHLFKTTTRFLTLQSLPDFVSSFHAIMYLLVLNLRVTNVHFISTAKCIQDFKVFCMFQMICSSKDNSIRLSIYNGFE